ncbi:MotA/TolQ/ExbB proton channel family protein [Telmatospirillum siberiense]|uniref:Flagellar motor protein MotA n=1 Tax=Telmatospirillum siberiense TaxID=382514 RepID=A0A2N3PYY1_9PROT|nr:MotA/TolQ/ExbB proton channel family protein [Telmatospirillum siberiense]PKU25610.1 flagellar motor protein MotA [Telmatospirillum siberiense]
MSPIDLSLTTIFQQATGVVQAVLVILALCSVLCWSIILEKAVLLIGLSRQTRALEKSLTGGSLAGLPANGLAGAIALAGKEEAEETKSGESVSERRQRIERAMRDAMYETLVKSETRLPYLATIGSSAPFIGLFGTVWGIMHSFAAIASANDTSLAVVAPGIAEALSTTAVGLAAAIPASIAYNKLAADFGSLARRLALAIGRMVRRMDGGTAPNGAAR